MCLKGGVHGGSEGRGGGMVDRSMEGVLFVIDVGFVGNPFLISP